MNINNMSQANDLNKPLIQGNDTQKIKFSSYLFVGLGGLIFLLNLINVFYDGTWSPIIWEPLLYVGAGFFGLHVGDRMHRYAFIAITFLLLVDNCLSLIFKLFDLITTSFSSTILFLVLLGFYVVSTALVLFTFIVAIRFHRQN